MVNPNEKSILGHPTYPTLTAIEEPVDVAIVAIPARKVLGVLDEAISKGVKNLWSSRPTSAR